VLRKDPSGALRGSDPPSGGGVSPRVSPLDPAEVADDGWSWPPYAPVAFDDEPFDTTDWAPSSVVWHPYVRVGRWTLVYRRW
jgi:hypothetical protein